MSTKQPNKTLRLVLLLLLILALAALIVFALMPNANQTSAQNRAATGISMRAEAGTSSELQIERATPGVTEPQGIAKDSWTIFVYLCGSDLESQSAAASTDINEMLQGAGAANINVVIETGGAKSWRNNTMKSNELGRYLVNGGNLTKVGSLPTSDMGEADTLADFLSWGIQNYPADHMALILWDHGGGSIAGVCFDEINSRNSLYLREVDTALNQAFGLMWKKFEFIGFDACLMSTLETANVLASYSDYMIASQESEPGGGWEYSSIIRYLSQNPEVTGRELGKAICDSYLASVDSNMKGFVTLSVIDLSKIDTLVQNFYRFSQEMYDSGSDQKKLATMTRAIQRIDNYGSNNRREGFTNMVDLGGLVEACASNAPSAAAVQQALADAVCYQINGTYHAGATGLSMYYPLAITSSGELKVFETIAPNPSYLAYIDRLAHGATYNGGSQYQQYSSDSIWGDNFWEWLLGNSSEAQAQAESNWSYVDEHEETSTQITFAQAPQIDEEGTFWFQFDQNGIDHAAVVSGMVYERDSQKGNYMALGETYDIYGDWETGEFADGFDGKWLSLPDGQALNLIVADVTEDTIIYASPIELNGTECYLRLAQDIASGAVSVQGSWTGVGEGGSLDRGLTPLQVGDVILPLYRAISASTGERVADYEGEEYTVQSTNLSINYDYLPEGDYLYNFFIQDVFGDIYSSASAQFEVDSTGAIYF